jgi:hypothetical protein
MRDERSQLYQSLGQHLGISQPQAKLFMRCFLSSTREQLANKLRSFGPSTTAAALQLSILPCRFLGAFIASDGIPSNIAEAHNYYLNAVPSLTTLLKAKGFRSGKVGPPTNSITALVSIIEDAESFVIWRTIRHSVNALNAECQGIIHDGFLLSNNINPHLVVEAFAAISLEFIGPNIQIQVESWQDTLQKAATLIQSVQPTIFSFFPQTPAFTRKAEESIANTVRPLKRSRKNIL